MINLGGGLGDGYQFDQCSDDHQRAGQRSREADAHLVEDNPREEKHEQEDIDKAACSGKETIV